MTDATELPPRMERTTGAPLGCADGRVATRPASGCPPSSPDGAKRLGPVVTASSGCLQAERLSCTSITRWTARLRRYVFLEGTFTPSDLQRCCDELAPDVASHVVQIARLNGGSVPRASRRRDPPVRLTAAVAARRRDLPVGGLPPSPSYATVSR